MNRFQHGKHFTLAEARSLLQKIKPLAHRMLELYEQLRRMQYDIYKHHYFGGRGPNGRQYHPQELEELVQVARSIENEGVVIKSVEEGLVDFPSIHGEEEIYLCWKVGEVDIAFWHGLTEGFQGRKPVSDLDH